MRIASLVTALVLAVVPASALAQGKQTLTMNKALTIAQQDSGGLSLLFGRVEGDTRNPVFGFYFLNADGVIVEREVGGQGKIEKDKVIDQIEGSNVVNSGRVDLKVVDALRVRTLTKLPAHQYFEIAQGRNGGQGSGYQLALVGDQLQVTVTGAGTDGSTWQTTMDMTTGRIIGN
jgi:hypothetical protein